MSAPKFKPLPLDISEDEPFKHDILSRQESGEVLCSFISSLTEPFVLAINSPWGTGKTTFLKMWQHQLRKLGFSSLYFNAWESDFSESPLVSLIGELGDGIESLRLGGEQHKTAIKVYQKTKKAGAALLKTALPAAIKLATAGILDLNSVTEADLGKLAENIAEKQIEKYGAAKKTISGFRKQLEDLVKVLSEATDDKVPKPVVFVIDELDRCRPTYAVELLEKVKHLFSVNGLVFVLAIDREQLTESVKALYGSGFDAEGYLKRFIDLDFCLPDPNHEKFVDAQFDRFALSESLESKVGDTRDDGAGLREVLPQLFSLFGFSLRTQEQYFTHLSIIFRTTPPSSYIYSFLVALLLCLRITNRKLYFAYCSGRAGSIEVLEYLRSLRGGDDLLDSHTGTIIEAYLIKGIRNDKKRSATVDAYLKKGKLAASTNEHDHLRAKAVSDHFQWIGRTSRDMTAYLFKKIELAQRFV